MKPQVVEKESITYCSSLAESFCLCLTLTYTTFIHDLERTCGRSSVEFSTGSETLGLGRSRCSRLVLASVCREVVQELVQLFEAENSFHAIKLERALVDTVPCSRLREHSLNREQIVGNLTA